MRAFLEEGEGDQRLLFHCPGCKMLHGPTVSGKGWEWNGSLETPTLNPSILVTGKRPIGPDDTWVDFRCHSYVREGRIEFLGDSTHNLAGQSMNLPDWEKGWKE